jgi:hypothetical protein
VSTTSTPNDCCQFWFEKQPEGDFPTLGKEGRSGPTRARHLRGKPEPLDCARPQASQFPLRPYSRSRSGNRSAWKVSTPISTAVCMFQAGSVKIGGTVRAVIRCESETLD